MINSACFTKNIVLPGPGEAGKYFDDHDDACRLYQPVLKIGLNMNIDVSVLHRLYIEFVIYTS